VRQGYHIGSHVLSFLTTAQLLWPTAQNRYKWAVFLWNRLGREKKQFFNNWREEITGILQDQLI